MKNKRIFTWVSICLLLAVAVSACSSTTLAEGQQKSQAVAVADPIAKDVLNGLQNDDFSTYTKDFDDKMLQASTKDAFEKLVQQLSSLGAFQGSELINVEVLSPYYRVNYKLTYANKVIIMRVVIPQNGAAKASGLWFN